MICLMLLATYSGQANHSAPPFRTEICHVEGNRPMDAGSKTLQADAQVQTAQFKRRMKITQSLT